MNGVTEKLNLVEVVKSEKNEEILKRRIKRLFQECFENPELNREVILKFLNREIDWNTIKEYMLHGEVVNCKLCGETSLTAFWCHPCIHPDWCCFCCILLGFPFYR